LTRNLSALVMFPLFRKRKVEQEYRISMENLVGLVKELRIPSADVGDEEVQKEE